MALARLELGHFSVDPARGFLPLPDPATRLPAGYEPWDALGADLPKLLATGKLVATLDRLPVLDAAGLDGPELRRAMLVLSFLGHGYVWADWREKVNTTIPPGVAVPWHRVAEKLGRPPVLSYASYALDNWRRIDPSGPIALGNVALLQNFLGGLDEEWFVAVHVDIEAKAGPLLAAVVAAQNAVAGDDANAVARRLGEVAAALEGMYATLARMPENCDPYIYYHRVRPYLHGFSENPVAYQGVGAYAGQPQTFFGETGAQSTIIPALDAALGIAHTTDHLRVYLNKMRDYMPPAHRGFLAAIENGPAIRPFVLGRAAGHPALRDTYNACVAFVEKFRAKHLEYAAAYIHKQSQEGYNSSHYGTGGTPFMAYLKKHRDETGRHILPPG